jgi:hypothetical protein
VALAAQLSQPNKQRRSQCSTLRYGQPSQQRYRCTANGAHCGTGHAADCSAVSTEHASTQQGMSAQPPSRKSAHSLPDHRQDQSMPAHYAAYKRPLGHLSKAQARTHFTMQHSHTCQHREPRSKHRFVHSTMLFLEGACRPKLWGMCCPPSTLREYLAVACGTTLPSKHIALQGCDSAFVKAVLRRNTWKHRPPIYILTVLNTQMGFTICP